IAGDVTFRSGIEVGFAARNGRYNALILRTQLPPGFFVLRGRNFAGKNLPAPLVDQQSKRQECHALDRALQQKVDVARRRRLFANQTELFQIRRRDGKRDGVSYSLMEAVVGAILEKRWLLAVRALVKIVTQFVVDRHEVFFVDVQAHLDTQIVFRVDVPGAGVADYFAVGRLGEQRALP